MAKKKKAPALERAFLDDVAANGSDDTPRLVFADWLEDQGQSDRAELIRLQCRLATMADGDPAREALEDRECELLAAFSRQWTQALPAWMRKAEPAFRRGLVGYVSVTARRFLETGEALFAAAPVREIHLRGAGRRLRKVCASPLLSRLASLDLSHNTLTDEDAAALTASPHLGGLTSLRLYGADAGPSFAGRLARWQTLPRLAHLDLGGNNLPPEGFHELASAPPLPSLRRLDLSDNAPDAPSLRALLAGGRLAGLTSLSLQRAARGDTVTALTDPGVLPSLRSLTVTGPRTDPEALAQLGATDLLAGLEVLDVFGTGLDAGHLRDLLRGGRTGNLRLLALWYNWQAGSSEAMEVLAAASLDSLRSLNLSETSCGPAEVRILAGSPRLRGLRSLQVGGQSFADDVAALTEAPWHLTELSLGRCDLDARTAAELAAWPGLAHVRKLNLSGNPYLGREGIAVLARSPYLKNLTHLSLNNTGTGDEGVRALAKADLPELRFIDLWDYHPENDSALRELANSPHLPRLLVLARYFGEDTSAGLKALGRVVVV